MVFFARQERVRLCFVFSHLKQMIDRSTHAGVNENPHPPSLLVWCVRRAAPYKYPLEKYKGV